MTSDYIGNQSYIASVTYNGNMRIHVKIVSLSVVVKALLQFDL